LPAANGHVLKGVLVSTLSAEGLFHLSMKMVQRAQGRSAVAAAAYRSATCLLDERTGRTFDFRKKRHVVEAFILAPSGAPEWVFDRNGLWNRAEAAEKRKDAVLAREMELSIPRDLPQVSWRAFVERVAEKFVSAGAAVDVAIHCPVAADGQPQPHAHITLTTRALDLTTETGFAVLRNNELTKLFESGGRYGGGGRGDALKTERARVAQIINAMLSEIGSARHVDARSYVDRGIGEQPEPHIGEKRMATVRSRRRHDRRTAVVGVMRAHRALINELLAVEEEMSQSKRGFPRLENGTARTDYKLGLLMKGLPGFDFGPYAHHVHMVDARRSDRIRIQLRDGGWVQVKGKRVWVWGTEGKAEKLANALLDFLEGEEAAKRLKKSVEVRHRMAARPARLTEAEITAIADRWRERGYTDLTEAADGVWVCIGETVLQDLGDEVIVHGPVTDDALRALAEKAKVEWGGRLWSYGAEEFRARLWLECQRQGVVVEDYEPPAKYRREWEAEVARKLAADSAISGVRRIANDAELLITAASGDEGALAQLDPDLRKFLQTYLDDDQRKELVAMQPIDVAPELARWRAYGHGEDNASLVEVSDRIPRSEEASRVSTPEGPRPS
jgi:hypothetical protein